MQKIAVRVRRLGTSDTAWQNLESQDIARDFTPAKGIMNQPCTLSMTGIITQRGETQRTKTFH